MPNFLSLLFIVAVVAAENMGVPYAAAPGVGMAVGLISQDAYYVPIALALFTGYFTGSMISYLIGGRGSYENMLTTLPKKKKDQVHKLIEERLKKHPGFAIVSAKMVGQIRPFASYIFGYLKIPPTTFAFWSVLGSLLITIYDLLLAELVFRLIAAYFENYRLLFYIIFGLLFMLPIIAFVWWRKKE